MCSLIRRTRAPHMESEYKLQHQLQRVSAAKLRSPRGRALGAWRSLAITLACSPRHHARIVLCIALALALAVATVLLLRSVLLLMRCVLLRVSGPPLVVGLDLLLDLLLGLRMLVGHLPPASLLLDLHHLDLLLQLLLAVAAVLGLAVSQDGVVLGVLLVLLQERDSVVALAILLLLALLPPLRSILALLSGIHHLLCLLLLLQLLLGVLGVVDPLVSLGDFGLRLQLLLQLLHRAARRVALIISVQDGVVASRRLVLQERDSAAILLLSPLALALAVATVLLLRSVLLLMRCVLLRVSGPPLVVGLDLLLDLLLGRRML